MDKPQQVPSPSPGAPPAVSEWGSSVTNPLHTHLGPQVRDADELLQHIFGKNVGVTCLLYVI